MKQTTKRPTIWTQTGLQTAAMDLMEKGSIHIEAMLGDAHGLDKMLELRLYLIEQHIPHTYERIDNQWVSFTCGRLS